MKRDGPSPAGEYGDGDGFGHAAGRGVISISAGDSTVEATAEPRGVSHPQHRGRPHMRGEDRRLRGLLGNYRTGTDGCVWRLILFGITYARWFNVIAFLRFHD